MSGGGHQFNMVSVPSPQIGGVQGHRDSIAVVPDVPIRCGVIVGQAPLVNGQVGLIVQSQEQGPHNSPISQVKPLVGLLALHREPHPLIGGFSTPLEYGGPTGPSNVLRTPAEPVHKARAAVLRKGLQALHSGLGYDDHHLGVIGDFPGPEVQPAPTNEVIDLTIPVVDFPLGHELRGCPHGVSYGEANKGAEDLIAVGFSFHGSTSLNQVGEDGHEDHSSREGPSHGEGLSH